MKSIKIIEIEPMEGLVLKAIEVESSIEHVSPCCDKIYHKFYCQNTLVQDSYTHKCDASGHVVFNTEFTIL